MLSSNPTRGKQAIFYLASVIGPILALLLRKALESKYGELPHYVLFYPAVLLVAMLGDAWAGLLATTTSAVLVAYWVLPPGPQFARTNDVIGLGIFCLMGAGISVIAELYHRNRRKLTTFQREQAVRVERRSADARYRTLFNSIDEGFCVVEVIFDKNDKALDYRILEVNPSFERQTGLVDAQGKKMRDLKSEHEEYWFEIYGRVALTGVPIRFQKHAKQLDSWFDVYAFRIGQPECRHVALLFNNITGRKQTEEALLRSEKLAAAGQMAVAIAHGLNNPLEAVTNLLFLAKETEGIPEFARQQLETADIELRRLTHITRQSLGFYRESTAPALTAVNAVLDSAVTLLESRIKARHAVIEKQWDGDVQVTAVAGELQQVFCNLLVNSLDAIDEKGTIKLRVKATHRNVRVTVADNGKGISAGVRQHLFEPFFTTKGITGSGLGLWVSKQIVEKHGGIIQTHSEADRGTVFSVVLRLPTDIQRETAA
ncbi:MAG: ATP-binding protein [Candidatus Korobacteraceae bacterium]